MAADPLTPIPLDELRDAVAATTGRLGDAETIPEQRSILTDVYHACLRATPGLEDPPIELLTELASGVGDVPSNVVGGLNPRARVMFRLLEAGAFEAAWLVCETSAAGLVFEPTTATTSSGAPRARPRFPLVVHVEAPKVYAWLPGFRDPRYDAPESCYDISSLVKLRARVDVVRIERSTMVVGGSASLSLVMPDANERVRLIARSDEDTRVITTGQRLRRPDLVSGVGDGLRRAVWSGWSVGLDLRKLRAKPGVWALALDVTHDGVRRAAPLGGEVGELAALAVDAGLRGRRRRVRLEANGDAWQLIVG